MTDTFFPPALIHANSSVGPLLANNITVASDNPPFALGAEEAQDDDGQISCVCGFSDDDGNTVACDSCNRWQHTLCYYPQYEGRELPEELQHYCVECRPQPFDATAAQSRQKLKREQQESLINAKRQTAKAQKKKNKDGLAASHINGWPLDKARHDRNSASPRDQPPPAKRPKTSHPASDSAVLTAKGHSRKRNISTAQNRSLSQSPDQTIEQYSPDFLRCYHEDEWTVTHANLHNDIAVTNALSEWLRASDDEFRNTHATEKREVLLRWDGELEDIPGKAQIEIRDVRDTRRSDDVNTPSWKIVTVKEPVAKGAYIGELKGHVGFMSQYKEDPSNRWPNLRHPEPFVFFHQSLHIYIDARNEGTELRYVRRSCRPNARLQILVTDQTDYRFCFMATEQIDPGMEVAIAWDTAESVPRSANGISTRDMDILSSWVSSVLSNCGPCACLASHGECAMSRFDRRRDTYDDTASGTKVSKRKKKAGLQSNSYLINSRSGSEARKPDVDDDRSESRSASASNRGSASRDITPNTHYSTNASLAAVPEMSERERKKLAKEEEMFRRQAEEQSGKGKKKRSSAGSNVNTPGAISARQVAVLPAGPRYADAGTSRQVGLPSVKVSAHKKARPRIDKSTPKRAHTQSRPKPDYAHVSTQVDMAAEEARRSVKRSQPSIKVISTQQYLLRYLAQKSFKRNGLSNGDHGRVPPMLYTNKYNPQPISDASAREHSLAVERAVVMIDEDHGMNVIGLDSGQNDHSTAVSTASVQDFSESPAPWQTQRGSPPTEAGAAATGDDAPRRAQIHLSMPPPTTDTLNSYSPMSAISPNGVTIPLAQSPSNLLGPPAPVFSPSVTAAVTHSPVRKKLSLSDYTRRSKAKDNKDVETKADRDSSPASTTSGPIVPPLQTFSSSEAFRANESVIEEDS